MRTAEIRRAGRGSGARRIGAGRVRAAGCIVLLGAGLVACGDEVVRDDCVDLPYTQIETTSFSSSLSVDLAQMTEILDGLYVQDLVVGAGEEAQVGSLVRVSYEGWLVDGTRFDGGENFQFVVGAAQVILGWDRGVEGMLVGGTRKLVIAPQLAYGLCSIGPIPGNSILVFDVQLTDVG